ncbi:MAG TPA: hypothetical protein VHP63_01255, partial [candidate division Zixibacteria bacterium]|nr:hypothetical protein [candidate division Zixibacteria bacterium]
MKKQIIIITVFMLVAAAVVFAQNAKTPAFHRWDKAMQPSKKHAVQNNPFLFNSYDRILRNREELGLTEDQTEKLQQMTFEFRTAQVERRANVEKARIVVEHLKSSHSAPEMEVMEAIDNLAMARAELEKSRFHFRVQVRSVLTPKQLEKLEGMIK